MPQLSQKRNLFQRSTQHCQWGTLELKDENSKILQTFKSNLDSVYRLSEFDQIIINVAITGLKKVIYNLKNVKGIDNPYLLPQSTLNTF